MKTGNVCLAALQQADGQMKPRPVIVLRSVPPYNDLLVCAVSSKLGHLQAGLDEIIGERDEDFRDSGLKVSSLVRLGLLATLPGKAIMGALGNISDERLLRLRKRLAKFIDS